MIRKTMVTTLYESAGSYDYPIQEVGSLSMAAAPEPSTWAMLAVGFGASASSAAGGPRASRPPLADMGAARNGGGAAEARFPCWLLTLQAQLQEKKIKPVLNRTVVALDS